MAYPRRRSWTTKVERALVGETLQQADGLARALLGGRAVYHLTWCHAAGGYVIHNEAGSKMLADR